MRKMMNWSHLLRTLACLCLLAFILVSTYYIAFFHVWPLSRDQWHIYAPYFEQGLWKTMWQPVSTHRHVFPYLFFHLDMEFFHGKNHLLVACGAFFDGLILCLLLKSLSREITFSSHEKTCLAVFVIAQFFWLLNIAQLGWGFMSTQYYLAILTFVLAICSANQFHRTQKSRWIVCCITCGFISTFSFGIGILVWPSLLYFYWIWRGSHHLFFSICLALCASLILFFILPGGDSIRQTLLWSPLETIRFVLQLAAGPVYYLLRSWRFIEPETLKTVASAIGMAASLTGIFLLIRLLIKRQNLSLFYLLCYALMLLGIGTGILISLTRATIFLDVWVDRYQIWPTLFWTGFIPILYNIVKIRYLNASRIFACVIAVFPLWALPSQLDMGSRLYEYKTRVQEALLFYQVGIPEKSAIKDALHWNWKHEIPFFFSVMNQLKSRHKNIYYQNPSDLLGSSLESFSAKKTVLSFKINTTHIETIPWSSLLERKEYPDIAKFHTIYDEPYAVVNSSVAAGYRITATIPDEIGWSFAISIDDQNIINGLGIHIDHSLLPRPAKGFSRRTYNFFGVVRSGDTTSIRWYLIDQDRKGERLWRSEPVNVSQANSR